MHIYLSHIICAKALIYFNDVMLENHSLELFIVRLDSCPHTKKESVSLTSEKSQRFANLGLFSVECLSDECDISLDM